MHDKPHVDEILAFTLMDEEFKVSAYFVGFSEANKNANMAAVVPVGIGQQKYDEHRSLPFGDRVPGECAATLVAKDLEISMTDALKRLLDYTLEHDSKGTRTNLDLADFINCLNKFFNDSQKTLEIGMTLCKALYENTYILTQADRDEVANMIDFLMVGKDKDTAGPILKFAKGLKNGNKNPYDLTEIYVVLKNAEGPEGAQEIIKILLEAKYFAQDLFRRALKELNPVKETREFIKLKNGKVEFLKNGIKLLTIESTNTEISKAARYRGADVIIHKNKDDVFVSSNKKSIDLTGTIDNIVAALRLKEQYCATGHFITTDPAILYSPGNIESDPWYFQTEDRGGKVMAKKDEKTKIPLQIISQIVKTILLLDQNFKWEVWKRKAINGNRYRARQNRV